MSRLISRIVFIAITLMFIQPSIAFSKESSRAIEMARAPWDSGWFHAEIVKQLIEKLGYRVHGPVTYNEHDFFRKLNHGELDFWMNAWLPEHASHLEGEEGKRIESIGYVIKKDALTGYMIDKKTADKFKIKTLADLKDPEIATHFDANGDGKADIFGCNPEMACGKIIDFHLKTFNLTHSVTQLRGNLDLLFNEVQRRYRQGQGVIYFSWVPNWTGGVLRPGKDVYWLPLPSNTIPEFAMPKDPSYMTSRTIAGCLSDPCHLGFAFNDIRAVANRQFLKGYPAIRELLSLFTISIDDLIQQNSRIAAGEDKRLDFEHHAKQWIEAHPELVHAWLEKARELLPPDFQETHSSDAQSLAEKKKKLKVATRRFEPFVFYEDGKFSGLSIDLLKLIARDLNMDYEITGVNSMAKLLDDVERGEADLAISGISITSEAEKYVDFTHSYFESGLQMMVREHSHLKVVDLFKIVTSIVFSSGILISLGIFLLCLLIAAHIMWFLERRHNPQFPQGYWEGILESLWWSVVTVTTVGYGDKTPQKVYGKIFAIFWMLVGFFVFAYFTANITTSVTMTRLEGTIREPQDLAHRKVALVTSATPPNLIKKLNLKQVVKVRNIDLAYDLLLQDKVEAVIYHSPVLHYFASGEGKGKVKVAGPIFEKQNYGIALPVNTPYEEEINTLLLKLKEQGIMQELYNKWFKD